MTLTRRDFLNGAAWVVPGVGLPAEGLADPSARTGLQGQTDEAMAAAHGHRDDPARAREAVFERDEGIEDLVVVGGGISGLAGAWLFQRHAGRPVRVLVLDAMDDVGGHARRNEFVARSGQRLVGYGGSQSLDTPGLFSDATHDLLRGLGIDVERFRTEFFDHGFHERHGLVNEGRFFAAEAWGRQRMVVVRAGETAADWLARTPLPVAAQADLLRLSAGAVPPPLRGLTAQAVRARLAGTTYRDFLLRVHGLHEAVARYLQQETQGYFGVGIDATSALDAWAAGLPGFQGLALGDAVDARLSPTGRQLQAGKDDYIYHFPDGNAGVVRALLRALRPGLLPGQGMDSLADARLDYRALDDDAEPVRVRLRATVTGLRHLGPPARADLVELRYVDAQGRQRAVRTRQVLLACWHRAIANLTDELPAVQRRALEDQVKVPLLYGTVLLSNWRAWQRAGLHEVQAPGGFWSAASLDFPVSMGSVRFAATPDDPVLVHLAKVVVPGDGRSAREQATAGRREMVSWDFAHLEKQVVSLLTGALGAFGFDAARDLEAMTINRWAHGYSYEYMRPWDRYWPVGPLPCETARRGWGRVAIANADAGAYAYAQGAIDQATRAVQELLPAASLPRWHRSPGPDARALGLPPARA